MKPPLLFATLSLILASPVAFGKSELEILRARCSEQERQIRLLETENSKLRTNGDETRSAVAKTTPPSAVPPKSEANPNTASSTNYTVKSGDSWEKISRKVGSTPQKLSKANGLKTSSLIHPGQKLKVPGAPAIAASTAATSTPSATPAAKTHQVREGETFASISKKHGVSTRSLISANPKINPATLRAGQVVSLGGSSVGTSMIAASKTPVAAENKPIATAKTPMTHQNIPVSTAEPISKPAPAPEAKAAPTPPPANQPVAKTESNTPPPENKIHPVTINGEMTYGEFATQHGTDTARLNALNGLDLTTATVLAKGSELYVPAQP